ncbi:MAG: hypothetical protein KDK91_29220 [Gammaproteobacteria bacterium]|nr:hypothetical protein [Gammaproteobacteria bacterium]
MIRLVLPVPRAGSGDVSPQDYERRVTASTTSAPQPETVVGVAEYAAGEKTSFKMVEIPEASYFP